MHVQKAPQLYWQYITGVTVMTMLSANVSQAASGPTAAWTVISVIGHQLCVKMACGTETFFYFNISH